MASGNIPSEQWLDGGPKAVATGSAWEVRWRAVLLKAAGLCLLAYCAVGAVMLTVGSAKVIHGPLENGYAEGPGVYGAVHAAQTSHLYSPLAAPPYTPQPYGPLYYALNAAIAKVSHLDVDLITVRLRLLVFGCFVLGGILVALIARELQFPGGSAILAGLMLLGQPDFYPNNVSVRPDMFCLAGMLLCLLAAMEGQASEWAYAASGLVAGMAFLIKQSAVAAPLAIATVLLLHRKFRQVVLFVSSAAVPVVVALAVLFWRREPFYEHFASAGQGVWSIANGYEWTRTWLSDSIIVIPLAIGAIGFAKAVGGGERSQMIAAFALANWCVALATIPQLGGSVNYFQPALAGCALLLPFAIRAICENSRSALVVALISVLLIWATFGEVSRERWPFDMRIAPRANNYASLAPFQILSDRTFFNLHGRNPQLLDPFLIHSMEANGHWDSSPIVAALDRGEFDMVILACTGGNEVCNYRGLAYFGAPIVDAINRNYSVMCSTLGPRVLKPRLREIAATPAMLGAVFGEPCNSSGYGTSPGLVFATGTR